MCNQWICRWFFTVDDLRSRLLQIGFHRGDVMTNRGQDFIHLGTETVAGMRIGGR